MKHYFGLEDVQAHYRLLKQRGVNVGEISVKPWMTMFTVVDPDGHVVVFFTRP